MKEHPTSIIKKDITVYSVQLHTCTCTRISLIAIGPN